MLKNYFKIALRNFKKYRTYAFINIFGLAVGLASCILIALYVLDELRYDRFHEHADRIVRLVEDQNEEGQESRLAITYGPLALALKEDVAAVEHAVRVLPYSLLVHRDAATKFQEDAFIFVDSTFFEVFTFPLLHGDARTALEAPFSVVLTATAAHKYFGSANPVGRTLQARDDENFFDFTVTGVVPDPPGNTHLRYDFLASFSSMKTIYGDWVEDPRNWEHPPLYTYALLADGADADGLEAQMPALALKHMGERRTATRSLHVQPLTDIRLHSSRQYELTPGSDITYVYIFSVIGFFILLIACINFMNLATARAASRTREVGMRKVMGAHRPQLIRQFLGESILLVTLALLLAVVLVELCLPVLNGVSGKALGIGALMHWSTPLVVIGIVLVVGLLAGSYPAFYLSGFRPARSLKGIRATGTSTAATLRKGLVVFQFAISIILIIGTAVVYSQLNYVQNERLGFDKEHVVFVPLRALDNQFNHASLKEAWKQLPDVEYVTASSGMPGLSSGLYDFMVKPENAAQDSLELMTLTVDHDYARTYGLEIVEGRDFSEDFTTDATEGFLINQSTARKLGWTDPIGQELTLQVWFQGEVQKTGKVVGVIKDFQYHSLHRAIDPMLVHIFPNTYYYDYLSVRLRPGNVPETLAALERAWNQFNPERPFEYTFLDEKFDALYRAEERLSLLFGYFSILAVMIACLGLFGLAAFTAEQRTKEIGLRKTLGATVGGIVLLLSKDLLKLIAVAFVVGAPLAFLVMNRWLEDFAVRVDISWPMFLVVGLTTLALAWLTVGYHAIRAALADPVESLRYE